MRQQQSGFTLIEIAIVLVIIGLLLGGVLKGQELITQAKIKNVINDFNGVSTAVYGYQDRYRRIPGDDPAATTRWTILNSVTLPATAGDGQLTGNFDDNTSTYSETQMFWADLRLAGFISGDTATLAAATALPQNAASGNLGVQWATVTAPGAGGGSATSPLQFSAPGLLVCSTQLPGKIAESVDVQLDDGHPNTGSIRAFESATPIPNTAATGYKDDATTVYTICKLL